MDAVWIALTSLLADAFAGTRKDKILRNSPTIIRAINATSVYVLSKPHSDEKIFGVELRRFRFAVGDVFVLMSVGEDKWDSLAVEHRFKPQYIQEHDYPERLARLKAALGD